MNLRLASLCAALLALLPGCAILEPGNPSAAVTVKGRSAFDVRDVVERVLIDDGYQPIQRAGDDITFERKASKADRLFYGNWNEGEVTQRVRITIAERGEETYRVRCLPSVVRDPHDVSFEDQHRRYQPFSFHYSSLLREIRRQCNELWLSRDPAASE